MYSVAQIVNSTRKETAMVIVYEGIESFSGRLFVFETKEEAERYIKERREQNRKDYEEDRQRGRNHHEYDWPEIVEPEDPE